MNRRKFLQKASLISLSLLFPGLAGWAYSNPSAGSKTKKLLVVFLRGACDGLNVVIPYADPRYYEMRPSIAVARPGEASGALDLDGHFGLHPALAPLMPLWKERTMAFVHCCGSPDPSRSHFDAQDFMESGRPGVKTASTGWMNRLLSLLPDNHSPLHAVNFGPTPARIFQGPLPVASVAIGPAAANKMPLDHSVIAHAFEELYAGRDDALGKAFADGMEAKRKIAREFDQEMVLANRGAPLPNAARNFGKQMARLLAKDETIQLAFLALGGWDTHVNQGAAQGQLANHLAPVGEGLAELISGLGPAYRDTTIIVVSEFGRTVKENGNGGTDHGHGNVMWLLGSNVQGGKVFGRWSGLAEADLFEQRDLPVTTDFRQIVSEILANELDISAAGLAKIFPDFKNTPRSPMGLLKT